MDWLITSKGFRKVGHRDSIVCIVNNLWTGFFVQFKKCIHLYVWVETRGYFECPNCIRKCLLCMFRYEHCYKMLWNKCSLMFVSIDHFSEELVNVKQEAWLVNDNEMG